MINQTVNSEHFDFGRLSLQTNSFLIESFHNYKFVQQRCQEAALEKKAIVLLTEPGYGTKTAIEKYLKTFGTRYYFADCAPSYKMRAILTDFMSIDLPASVPLYASQARHLVDGLAYLFSNVNGGAKKRILILHNVQNLPLKEFEIIHNLILKIKGMCGVLITMSNKRLQELEVQSEKETYLRDFLTEHYGWYRLQQPDLNELKAYCMERGIIGLPIIERLLKKGTDFKLLNLEIEKIKELLIKRGFVMPEKI